MSANSKRRAYRWLALGRLIVALGVLALFLRVYTSPLQKWSTVRVVVTDVQFTGALMRGGVFGVVALAILGVAALVGRWYCSVLCPFGTLQEAVWRAGRATGRKTRFIAPSSLRYIVPVLTGIGLVAFPPLFLTMDPISNFGRGVRSLYALLIEGVVAVTPSMWAMLTIFAFALALAAARGRRFCDWCPVGTLLGAFASVAPFGVRLRKEACVSCGNCERSCPMNCIDSKNKTLDGSRCVLCLSCAGSCAVGALEYGAVLPAEKAERRAFLRKSGGVLAALAGAVYLGGAAMHRLFPGGMGTGRGSGTMPFIMPPGARNVDDYFANCIGCQACVAACPADIVRADDSPHPRLDYMRGYCQYNCTECSRVCPSHALRPLHGEKQRTRIALSALDREKCVVITKGESCGACAEVCPTHALRMVPLTPGSSLTAPVFEPEYCIGCGGCFHVCPAEPRAFVVTGVTPQTRTPGIRPTAPEAEAPAAGIVVPDDEFPF